MDKTQYKAQRDKLFAEAETLLAENKVEEANAKSAEIEKLDKDFEAACLAKANLEAMKDKTVVNDFSSNVVDIVKNAQPADKFDAEAKKDDKSIYTNAFAKYLLSQPLDKNEQEIFNKVNDEFKNTTQTAGTHTVLIPETVRDGIWKEIGNLHPILGDLAMTFVQGNLTIIKETSGGDAAKFYDEATSTEEGTVAFGEINLTGCELAKAVKVSWLLKKMSIDKFLPYIQTLIAEKMADGLAYGVVQGKGKPSAQDTFKPEPKGILTVLAAENSTPQIVTFDDSSDKLDYDKITDVMGKLKSGYLAGAAFYAKNATIWGHLAKIKDDEGKPMFVSDPTGAGVGRLFGVLVKEDDSIPADAVLLANVSKGYACNVNENMTMYQEDHIMDRETEYMGYAIVDGDVLSTKAFVYLKKS